MASLIENGFNCQFGDEYGQTVIDVHGFADVLENNPPDVRFVANKDRSKELWLVLDTLNGNTLVGVHESETLAFLDAAKREQDAALLKTSIH
mgnify:CR=1 FL=1